MRGIVICPNIALRRQFEEATAQYNLTLVKRLDSYPSPDAFGRLARAWAPDVVFLSLENHWDAAAFCRDMEAEFPDLQRIGIHSNETAGISSLILDRLEVGANTSPWSFIRHTNDQPLKMNPPVWVSGSKVPSSPSANKQGGQ
jgi:hypothetical protein